MNIDFFVLMSEKSDKNLMELFQTFSPKKPVDYHIDPHNMESLESLVEKLGSSFVADVKKDGYNVAVHVSETEVKLFTSSGREFDLERFPEIARDAEKLDVGIYIGEFHGKENKDGFTNLDSFQAVKRRVSGSANLESLIEECPVEISLYDIYRLEDQSLLDTSFMERRKILETTLKNADTEHISVVGYYHVDSAEQLKQIYTEIVENGSEEGLVLKRINAKVRYRTDNGSIVFPRTDDFVKLKRSSDFDCVVLATYLSEKGAAKNRPYTNLLLGVLNSETGLLETLVKSSGIAPSRDYYEKIWSHIQANLEEVVFSEETGEFSHDDQAVFSKRIPGKKVPQFYVRNPLENSIVLKVRAMQVTKSKSGWHSCGLTYNERFSLRHPVIDGIHPEKQPRDCNTTQDIRRSYYGISS